MGLSATKKSNKQSTHLLRYSTGISDLGTVLVASSAKGVVAVLIGANRTDVLEDLARRFPTTTLVLDDANQQDAVSAVVGYIHSPKRNVDLDLDMRGTDFQRKVWQAVRQIPLGSTITYTELATQIGKPKAARAVGNACTINPLAFVVPCHRVLHSNPALSFGHNRGNDRMRPMVAREQKQAKFSEP